MPSTTGIKAPSLEVFAMSIRSRGTPIESSIENLVSLFQRRQIRNAFACATATAYLLRRVVEIFKVSDVAKLLERVRQVGRRLIAAQPRELAIGNIVRRVLGVIHEEVEEERELSEYSDAGTNSHIQSQSDNGVQSSNTLHCSPRDHDPNTRTEADFDRTSDNSGAVTRHVPLVTVHTPQKSTIPASMVTSMFSLLSHPYSSATLLIDTSSSQFSKSPRTDSHQVGKTLTASKDLRAEVIEGIQEILDELNQADDQIAGYALDHIQSNETILTYYASATVQRFLLKAATKRKITVVHAVAESRNHKAAHANLIGIGKGDTDDEIGPEAFTKALTAVGIRVVLIPDSAVFALMSRVNKVLLNARAILANGSLVVAAGTKAIVEAARMQRTHVIVLNAVYQLSPVYPFSTEALLENGDPSQAIQSGGDNLVIKVETEDPLSDYVSAGLIDLYITNLGGHARSYLYRVVQDHYRTEDIDLDSHNEAQC